MFTAHLIPRAPLFTHTHTHTHTYIRTHIPKQNANITNPVCASVFAECCGASQFVAVCCTQSSANINEPVGMQCVVWCCNASQCAAVCRSLLQSFLHISTSLSVPTAHKTHCFAPNHTQTHKHTQTQSCTHTHTHIHFHAHTQKHIHSLTLSHTITHLHTSVIIGVQSE